MPNLIPRIPRRQRTSLVTNLLHSAQAYRATAQDLKKKYKAKCDQLKTFQKNLMDEALAIIKEKVSPAFFKILTCQLRNAGRNRHGYRYTNEEKTIFYGLRQSGPRCFHTLPCIKPTRSTVRAHMKKLNLKPGISPIIVRALKERVNSMAEPYKEVSVVFDEAAIQCHYDYDPGTDTVMGFVDLGDGVRRPMVAEEIMTAMIRSIFGSWKMPFAYWCTNQKMTKEDFQQIFTSAIRSLLSTGLKVRTIILDGLAKNKAALFLMGASPDSPWIDIDGWRVFITFDVPHLLKCLRNALLIYELQLADGTIISKKWIDQFIEMDLQMKPRLVKKVTRTHLQPNTFQRMSVPLAAQLLHKKVAAGIMAYATFGALPVEAMPTATWLERVSNLFQSHNGIDYVENPDPDNFRCAFTDFSPHLELWEKMYQEMQGWKFIGSRNIKFVESWLMTLKSHLHLWLRLKEEGYLYLPLGSMTQDCLENFYSFFRKLGGHRHNPAPKDLPATFAAAMTNLLATSVKGKNCRDDNALNLLHLQTLFDIAEEEAAKRKSAERADVTVSQSEASSNVSEPWVPIEVLEDSDVDDEEDVDEPCIVDEPSDPTPDDPPPSVCDNSFLSRLQEQMGRVASAEVASPLVDKYMKTVEGCEECQDVLLTEAQFPLHILHTMTAGPHNVNQLKPSETVARVVQVVYSLAAKEIPPVCHNKSIITDFIKQIKNLPEVQGFQLCGRHQDRRQNLLQSIALEALREILLKMNQDLKEKRKLKKQLKKLQRVSHQ